MLPCKLNNSCPLFNLFDLDYNNLLRALELGVFFFGGVGGGNSAQHNSDDSGSLCFPFRLQCSGSQLCCPRRTAVRGHRARHAPSFPFLVAPLEEELICSFPRVLPCPCRAFLERLKRNPSSVTCSSPVWWFE